MAYTLTQENLALYKSLIENRNRKIAQWKTFTDSNQVVRCALSEMPTEECLFVDKGCCNCRKYKPAEFIVLDSQKVYYDTIEKYLNEFCH